MKGMKHLSLYDNCLGRIAGCIEESQRRKEILSYFKSNVDSTEEDGGYKIHERRVRACMYLFTDVGLKLNV
jgi:hypothetical protein